jgi:hypothetical protein
MYKKELRIQGDSFEGLGVSSPAQILRDQPEELTLVLGRLEKEYQQLQAGRKKVEKGAADGSERKESSFARLKKELQELLADRKKRPAVASEPRTDSFKPFAKRPVRFAAKQKPHRPGIAPALSQRARGEVFGRTQKVFQDFEKSVSGCGEKSCLGQ